MRGKWELGELNKDSERRGLGATMGSRTWGWRKAKGMAILSVVSIEGTRFGAVSQAGRIRSMPDDARGVR